MAIATITGTFTYKLKSGREVEFDYTATIYGVEDHLADEVQVEPSYGEDISEAEYEDELEAIEEKALDVAIEKFRKEFGNE